MKEEEIKLLDINMFASIVFILTIIVSTVLTYNEKLILLGEEPLFNGEDAKTITIVNRTILLIVASLYVYSTYREYKINQISGTDNATKSSFVHLIANELQLLIVGVITLLPMIYPEEEPEEELEEVNILTP